MIKRHRCKSVVALLRLTSLLPVRTSLHKTMESAGAGTPGIRGGGARPGARRNAPPSWHRHGPCCPDNGPLGETGSSSNASTSTTGVLSERPSSSWFQWDSSLPAPGVKRRGCGLPRVSTATGAIPGHRSPGSIGSGEGVRPRLMPHRESPGVGQGRMERGRCGVGPV